MGICLSIGDYTDIEKMTLVKQLIKAKGLTQADVARILEVPYHSLIKTLTKTAWRTKNGEVKFRECRHIREKVAVWLGCPYELIWGPGSDFFLRKLITEEIERQVNHQIKQRLQALGIL